MLDQQPSAPATKLAAPDLLRVVASEPALAPVTALRLIGVQEQPPTVKLGVRIKLVALMGAVSLLIVSVLASYFPARQIAEVRTELQERASAYGRLGSLQLRSAVAFKDKETAREVLGAIVKDPLVKGATLYADDGTRLDGEGTLSDLAHSARRGFGQPRMFLLPGRVLVTIPVRSLEGPGGTLVMELSTARANAARAQLIRVALAIGGGALLLGTALAWGIARSLASRVESIARAASKVAQGDLDQTLDLRGPRDEIGVLAHAFDAMVRRLRTLIAHIHETAREENARLELIVRQRTEQLDRRNADLRLVLDNVEQGFVTIDRAGDVLGEQSRIVERWLGEVSPGDCLWRCLDRVNPGSGRHFEVAWSQLVDDCMPIAVCLAQMPRECTILGRHLRFEYNPLGSAEVFDKLLVVISDATAAVERDRNERQDRDLLNLSSRLLNDRAGFLEFAAETNLLLERIAQPRGDAVLLKRDLHTLKGNTAIFGLASISACCHELESALDSGADAESLDCSPVAGLWQGVYAKARQLIGDRPQTGLEVDEREYLAVLAAVRAGADAASLERRLGAWRLEPLRVRLERAAEQLTAIAARAGKGHATVGVHAEPVYLAREELSEFWSVFAHVIRNGVAHGLDSIERRSGDRNDFELRAGMRDGSLFVELEDRGPGIDWSTIRDRALERGLPAATEAELVEALFADGLSARHEVTEFSGRGVGLSAVREACLRRRGKVDVAAAPGSGTRFRFSFPTSELASLVQLDAGAST